MTYLKAGTAAAATDMSIATAVGKDGSAAQTAVDARILPVAAAVVAADETVTAAAAAATGAAIDVALADGAVISGSDPRVGRLTLSSVPYAVTDASGHMSWVQVGADGGPTQDSADWLVPLLPVAQEIGYDTQWAYVATDAVGQIAFGIRKDGSMFPEIGSGVVYSDTHSALLVDEGVLIETLGTGTLVLVEAEGAVLPRLTAERLYFTLEGVEVWVPVTGGTPWRVVPVQVIAWGDSLTYANGGRWTNALGVLLGKPVITKGVSGERSEGIAARQGGIRRLVTVSGGSIPASGPVNVTADGVFVRPNQYQSAGTQRGILAGVHGTLSQEVDYSGIWQFTRTTPGAVVPVPAPVPWITDDSATYRDSLAIFWTGRNSFPNDIGTPTAATSATAIAVQQMVDFIAAGARRFLVMPVINGTGEGIGTPGYDRVLAHEAWLAATYPHNNVPIRRVLIDQGLAMVGITPTEGDLADIAADLVPRSLRVDYIHLTQQAYELVIAPTLHAAITEKGWL